MNEFVFQLIQAFEVSQVKCCITQYLGFQIFTPTRKFSKWSLPVNMKIILNFFIPLLPR